MAQPTRDHSSRPASRQAHSKSSSRNVECGRGFFDRSAPREKGYGRAYSGRVLDYSCGKSPAGRQPSVATGKAWSIVGFERQLVETLLRGKRRGESCWGHQPGCEPRVEPTAFAALALSSMTPTYNELAVEAGRWILPRQTRRGGLPMSRALTESPWATACSLLLWNATSSHPPNRQRAREWLLTVDHSTGVTPQDRARSFPAGWPWVEGTYTWVEPTALAILALLGDGESTHLRISEGYRMLHERALPHGGWNSGNTLLFGHELRPQTTSTALALLALAARREKSSTATDALQRLLELLDLVHSSISLGWALLALRAWDALPPNSDSLLENAASLALERHESNLGLALLLLASSNTGLRPFLTRPASPPAQPQLSRGPQ